MKNFFVTFLLAFSLLLVPAVSHAEYVSDNCPGDPKSTTVLCPAEKVGFFLQGITNNCGNTGTCTLGDIMTVVANVGNFVLKIIGAIVLFMYVLGGFWILASHGNDKWVSKGKDTLKISTTGLIIVMVAYLGVQTLYKYVTNQTTPGAGGTFVASCSPSTEGQACGPNQVCHLNTCLDECTIKGGQCMGVVDPTKPPAGYSSCSPSACPTEADSCCIK